MTGSPRKRQWELTQESLQALLSALDQEPSAAAEKYELLRNRLVKFFEWRSIGDSRERADVVLNRIAGNLRAGGTIGELNAYAYGVARRIALETAREAAQAQIALRDLRLSQVREPTLDLQADCLTCCLGKLSREDREIIVAYYQGEKRDKIENRKRLAQELGLAMNGLRIRACRIRATLEDCIGKCVGERGG